MKIHLIIFAVLALVSLTGCTFLEQPERDSISEGEIGQHLDQTLTPIINEAMKGHAIPGLAIGVVVENQIVYARGFGVENTSSNAPVTTRSVFHMASVSKPFVATAIMQLVEAGKIDLDSPVIDYLPYFEMRSEEYKAITVRQMLGHISGMPNSNDYEWNQPQYDEEALERFVKSLSKEELELQPGERFRYSNIAFEVLGDVIAKVSGKSFEEYQQEFILAPSGMTESTFLKPEHLPEGWVAPHAWGLEEFPLSVYPYNRRHAPSSTLHSSAYEMSHWAITNLNHGTYNDLQILTPESYQELWNPWVQIDDEQLAQYEVGLSWFVGEYRGERTISHGGSDEGFHSHFILLPEQSIGVVVMANTLPTPIEEISYIAIDSILGHELTPIKPLASMAVWELLLEGKSMDDAVEQWNTLKTDHLDEYDFGIQQFINLYFVVKESRSDDAERIASFYKRALSADELLYLQSLVAYVLAGEPENQTAIEVLEILQGS